MSEEQDRFEARAAKIIGWVAGVPGYLEIRKVLLPVIADVLRYDEAETLERAAQVAKQSQMDCFCADKSDELLGGMPCAGCMEAARIEDTLRGLADRCRAHVGPTGDPST